MRGFERLLTAMERIEEIYVDGGSTYDDWRAMGELARVALHEPNAKGMARGLAAPDSDNTTEIDG